MRRLLKIVALGMLMLAIGLMAYGGLLVYAHYRTGVALERLASALAPQLKLRHGAMRPDLLDGELVVENLELEVAGLGTVFIAHTVVSRPDRGFFLNPQASFRNGSLPSYMELRVERVSIPLPERMGASRDACSLRGILRLAGLQRLGLLRLQGAGRLAYEYDAASANMLLHLEFRSDSLGDLALDAELGDLLPALFPRQLPTPRAAQLQLRLMPDLLRRQLAFCAGDQTPLGYLNHLLERSPAEQARDLGWVPGPGLRQLIAGLYGRGGLLELTLRPQAGLTAERLAALDPRSWSGQLGAHLRLDGQVIDDLTFSLPGRAPIAGDTPDGELPRPAPPRYRPTAVEQLGRYIGFRVRLHVGDDTPAREGVLAELVNGRASLEQRLQGGRLTLYVPLRTVRRAEVWRGR